MPVAPLRSIVASVSMLILFLALAPDPAAATPIAEAVMATEATSTFALMVDSLVAVCVSAPRPIMLVLVE